MLYETCVAYEASSTEIYARELYLLVCFVMFFWF